jgi:hypothetical protein
MPVKNFEPLNINTDITTTKTLIHEAIPLSGVLVSGTYDSPDGTSFNIKDYSHGMFQSVYDYPYLSSSANHIFDIAVGYDESSAFSGSSNTQNAKKINMYNQFAQVLLGYTGSEDQVRMFESDLKLDRTGSMTSVFFLNFSRLLTKDQIKKGSFSITVGTGSWANPYGAESPAGGALTLTDASASVDGTGVTNTIGGDYGILFHDSNTGVGKTGTGLGVIFYQAGIVALTSSIWDGITQFNSGSLATNGKQMDGVSASFTGSAISASCDALRHRIRNISFQNTTEINSTIYFCRAPHNKFNYSSNPTYTSGSSIRVKAVAADHPVSYITTVGLYNAANELLAIAKLSEPLKKTPETDMTIRVRLDY